MYLAPTERQAAAQARRRRGPDDDDPFKAYQRVQKVLRQISYPEQDKRETRTPPRVTEEDVKKHAPRGIWREQWAQEAYDVAMQTGMSKKEFEQLVAGKKITPLTSEEDLQDLLRERARGTSMQNWWDYSAHEIKYQREVATYRDEDRRRYEREGQGVKAPLNFGGESPEAQLRAMRGETRLRLKRDTYGKEQLEGKEDVYRKEQARYYSLRETAAGPMAGTDYIQGFSVKHEKLAKSLEQTARERVSLGVTPRTAVQLTGRNSTYREELNPLRMLFVKGPVGGVTGTGWYLPGEFGSDTMSQERSRTIRLPEGLTEEQAQAYVAKYYGAGTTAARGHAFEGGGGKSRWWDQEILESHLIPVKKGQSRRSVRLTMRQTAPLSSEGLIAKLPLSKTVMTPLQEGASVHEQRMGETDFHEFRPHVIAEAKAPELMAHAMWSSMLEQATRAGNQPLVAHLMKMAGQEGMDPSAIRYADMAPGVLSAFANMADQFTGTYQVRGVRLHESQIGLLGAAVKNVEQDPERSFMRRATLEYQGYTAPEFMDYLNPTTGATERFQFDRTALMEAMVTYGRKADRWPSEYMDRVRLQNPEQYEAMRRLSRRTNEAYLAFINAQRLTEEPGLRAEVPNMASGMTPEMAEEYNRLFIEAEEAAKQAGQVNAEGDPLQSVVSTQFAQLAAQSKLLNQRAFLEFSGTVGGQELSRVIAAPAFWNIASSMGPNGEQTSQATLGMIGMMREVAGGRGSEELGAAILNAGKHLEELTSAEGFIKGASDTFIPQGRLRSGGFAVTTSLVLGENEFYDPKLGRWLDRRIRKLMKADPSMTIEEARRLAGEGAVATVERAPYHTQAAMAAAKLGMVALSASEMAGRGGDVKRGAVSPTIIQALAGDADGESAAWYLRFASGGRIQFAQNENGRWVNMATKEEMTTTELRNLAAERAKQGAQDIWGMNPKAAPLNPKNKMLGEFTAAGAAADWKEGLLRAADPENRLTYEQAAKVFMTRQQLFSNVGPQYQTWRKIAPLAQTRDELDVADKLQVLSHEISQRPEPLTPELQAYQMLLTMNPTGHAYNRTKGASEQRDPVPGAVGYMHAASKAMLGLYETGQLTAKDVTTALLGGDSDAAKQQRANIEAMAEQELATAKAEGRAANWGRVRSALFQGMTRQEGAFGGGLLGRAILGHLGTLARTERTPVKDAEGKVIDQIVRTRTPEEQIKWLLTEGGLSQREAAQAVQMAAAQDAAQAIVSKKGSPRDYGMAQQTISELGDAYPVLGRMKPDLGDRKPYIAGVRPSMAKMREQPDRALYAYMTQGMGMSRREAIEYMREGIRGTRAGSDAGRQYEADRQTALKWAAEKRQEELFNPKRGGPATKESITEEFNRANAGTGANPLKRPGLNMGIVEDTDIAYALSAAEHVRASALGFLDPSGSGLSEEGRLYAMQDMIKGVAQKRMGGAAYEGGSPASKETTAGIKTAATTGSATAAEVAARADEIGLGDYGREFHGIAEEYAKQQGVLGRTDWTSEKEAKAAVGAGEFEAHPLGKYEIGWNPDLLSLGDIDQVQQMVASGMSVDEIRASGVALPRLLDIKPTEQGGFKKHYPQLNVYRAAIARKLRIDPRLVDVQVAPYDRSMGQKEALAGMFKPEALHDVPFMSEEDIEDRADRLVAERKKMAKQAAYLGVMHRKNFATPATHGLPIDAAKEMLNNMTSWMEQGYSPYVDRGGKWEPVEEPFVGGESAGAGGGSGGSGSGGGSGGDAGGGGGGGGSGDDGGGGGPDDPGDGWKKGFQGVVNNYTSNTYVTGSGKSSRQAFGYYQLQQIRGVQELMPWLMQGRALWPEIQRKKGSGIPLNAAERRFLRLAGSTLPELQRATSMTVQEDGLSPEQIATYREAVNWGTTLQEDPAFAGAAVLHRQLQEVGQDFWTRPSGPEQRRNQLVSNAILRGGRSEGPTSLERLNDAIDATTDQLKEMVPAVRAARERFRELAERGKNLSDDEREEKAELTEFLKAAGRYRKPAAEKIGEFAGSKEMREIEGRLASGRDLTKKQEEQLIRYGKLLPMSFAPGQEAPSPEQSQLMAARQAMEDRMIEEEGGVRSRPLRRRTFEDFGTPGGIAKVMGDLTSGWELFRLRRMWQMTGGPVFSEQIPTAAKAEMAYWQAANVAGGYAPGATPGGVAGGLMATEAMKQWQMIQAGQIGYRAWGDTMGLTSGLKSAQALLGPAAGIGLVGGSIATTIGAAIPSIGGMAAASTMIGLPVTLGLGALATGYGVSRLAESYAEPTAANQLELASEYKKRKATGSNKPNWKAWLTSLGYRDELVSQGMGLIPANLEAGKYALQQRREGMRLYDIPIDSMPAEQRSTAYMQLAKDLAAKPKTIWEGTDPTKLAEIIAQQAAYEDMGADTLNKLLADATAGNPLGGMPESIQMALGTGKTAADYQGLADTLLGGRKLALSLQTSLGKMGASQEADAMKAMQQFSYLVTGGKMTGEELRQLVGTGAAGTQYGVRSGMAGALTGQLEGARQQLASTYGVPITSPQVQGMLGGLETIAGGTVGWNLWDTYRTSEEQLKAWEEQQTAYQYAAPVQRATGRDWSGLFRNLMQQGRGAEYLSRYQNVLSGTYAQQWGVTPESRVGQMVEGMLANRLGQGLPEFNVTEQAQQYASGVFKARGAAADIAQLTPQFERLANQPNMQSALAAILEGQYAQAAGVAPDSAQGRGIAQYFKSITDKAVTPSHWTTTMKLQREAEVQRELEQEQVTYQYASSVFKQRGGSLVEWQDRAKRYTDPDDLQRWAEAVNGAMFEQLGMVLGSTTQKELEKYAEQSLAGSETAMSAWKMGLGGAVNVAQMRGLGEQETLGLTKQFMQMQTIHGVSPQAMSIVQQQMLGTGAVSQAMGLPAYLGGNYEAGLQQLLSTGRMSPVQYQGIAGLLGSTMNQTGYAALTGAFGKGLQGQWQSALGMLGQFGINVPMPTGPSPLEVVNGGLYGMNELALRSLSQQATLGTGQWATAQATPWNAMQWQKNAAGQMQYAPVLNMQGQQVQYGGGTYQMGMYGDLAQMQKDYGTWKQTTGISNKLADLSAASSMQGLIQSLENLELSYRKFQANTAFQRQEMGIQWTQMQTQQQWGREDVAYGRMTAGLQYGWQQEDYDREIRYATGRQKRQLMRERDRAQEMYAIQEGRRGTEEERMETQFQWQEEAYARQKAHFEEMTALEEESFALQKKHIGERMAMLGAQTALQKQLREIEQAAQDEKYLRAIAEKEASIEQTKLQYGLSNAQADANAQMQLWLTNLGSLTTMLTNLNTLMGSTTGAVGNATWLQGDEALPVNQPLKTKKDMLEEQPLTLEATFGGLKEMMTSVSGWVDTISPAVMGLFGEEGSANKGFKDAVVAVTTILDNTATWVEETYDGFEGLFGKEGLATKGLPTMAQGFKDALAFQGELVSEWVKDMAIKGDLDLAWWNLIERIKTWVASITFGGGGKAAGGPVKGNTTYLVGEQGPELFVPRTNGTIIPNGATSNIIEQILQGGGGTTMNLGGVSITVNVPVGAGSPEEIADAVWSVFEQKANDLAMRQRRKGNSW